MNNCRWCYGDEKTTDLVGSMTPEDAKVKINNELCNCDELCEAIWCKHAPDES